MLNVELSTGVLSVQTHRTCWPLEELFEVAERRNPKRAFLFVSKVLGRHIPVTPRTMRKVYQDLASQIPADLPGPVLFVGMAETAVGLAAGVHDEFRQYRKDTVLITSTRHPVDGELLCEFKEAHSHATDHLIYWPATASMRELVSQAASLVLIDDEATTGNTFANLFKGLQDAGLTNFKRLCTVTLTDWSDKSLSSRCDVPVTTIALTEGSWSWSSNPDAIPPVMPSVNVTAKGSATLSEKQDWGRLGVTDSVLSLGDHLVAQPNERVLVLGTGEFVWQPFLLAERLESEGANVRFGSISRSPIAIGHAIKSAFSFTDNYGLGIPNFVYNVTPGDYDKVIICTETSATAFDSSLLENFNNAEVVVYA